ncbi:hypothetical protein [Nocardia yamanashiensis]|uniref:hypothetical protein n=1 Tax=Nocardia yamanashiensis TaxID=209247 RepID=UPI0008358799|nr:hypothetical protein [Nocardia yamanashiensis]
MVFFVNGYRLSSLVKDPAAVDSSLTRLRDLLAASRPYLEQFEEHDLVDRLDRLADRLRRMGPAIDDAFDRDFRAFTDDAARIFEGKAATAGVGASDDPSGAIYWELSWAVVHLATVRIGGYGVIEHPGPGPPEN